MKFANFGSYALLLERCKSVKICSSKLLQNERIFAKSASMQPRTSPVKFAACLGIVSPDLGSFCVTDRILQQITKRLKFS